ncbi:MAG: hypothetical protein JNL74_17690, partial [Fibrobacteres bacterium]|nr:hypothetical protein [Fibrobacterota bacterium]
MMKKYLYQILLSILLPLIFISCGNDNTIAGGSSETGNAFVSGYVYNTDGSPAVNATVRFIPSGYLPKAGDANGYTAELKTDKNGLYQLRTQCAPGYYSIFSTLNTTAGYLDSVSITKETGRSAPTTTLKPSSTFSGKVRLEGNYDNRSVFIVIHGSEFFTTPSDTSGTFTIANMPEGQYSVRFFTTNDNFEIIDTSFSIISGQQFDAGTIVLKTKIAQPVSGFHVTYDSLKQFCDLSWSGCDTSRITGYTIYRVRSGGTIEAIAQINEKVNSYSDILPIP